MTITSTTAAGTSTSATTGTAADAAVNAATARGAKRMGLVGAVGVGYTASWIAGLCTWPSNPPVTSSAADVVSTFAAHETVAALQYTLTEGLPAIGLAVVGIALARAARSRPALLTGTAAALVSAVQCVLGVLLATVTAPHGHAAASLNLFQIVNRLDGVKMFLLAGLAISGVAVARRGMLPRWLGVAGIVLAALLVVSGVGYLTLNSTLAPVAFIDGPLLLVWVTGTAIVLGRTSAARRSPARA